MAAWQHAWISVDPTKPEDISKLETYGKEGWELVSVLPWNQQAPGGIFVMFFKRPVPDDSSSSFGMSH